MTNLKEDENVLEWVKLSQELAKDYPKNSGPLDKMIDHPLIPFGCVCTIGFLSYGIRLINTKSARLMNYMMRGRIIAHGITAAFIAALAYKKHNRMPNTNAEAVLKY